MTIQAVYRCEIAINCKSEGDRKVFTLAKQAIITFVVGYFDWRRAGGACIEDMWVNKNTDVWLWGFQMLPSQLGTPPEYTLHTPGFTPTPLFTPGTKININIQLAQKRVFSDIANTLQQSYHTCVIYFVYMSNTPVYICTYVHVYAILPVSIGRSWIIQCSFRK